MCNKEALLQDFFIYVPVIERAAPARRPGGDETTIDTTTLPPGHHDWVKIPLEKGLIVYARTLHKEKRRMARCS